MTEFHFLKNLPQLSGYFYLFADTIWNILFIFKTVALKKLPGKIL